MKKLLFVAAALVVTIASCTKDTVAPAKVKTNLEIGGKDTISNVPNAVHTTASDTISNVPNVVIIKKK